MKKIMKGLSLMLALAMSMSVITVNAAETTTQVYKEDFTNVTAYTDTDDIEGNAIDEVFEVVSANAWRYKIIKDESDAKLGLTRNASLKKTFLSPLTGMVGFNYKAAASESFTGSNESTTNVPMYFDVNLTYSDETTGYLRVALSEDDAGYMQLYKSNALVNGWNYVGIPGTVNGAENDIKVFFNTENEKLTVTVNGASKEWDLSSNVNIENIEAFGMCVGNYGLDSQSGVHYATIDDIYVYQKDVPVTPALTYLDKDFTDLSADFFGGDNYDGVKYVKSKSLSSKYSANDETGKQLITFSDGAMNVGYLTYMQGTTPREYYAMLPLSDDISDGIVDVSFRAHGKEAQGATADDFGMVKLMSSSNSELTSLWIWDTGAVNYNHQYAVASNGGVTAKSGLTDGYHNYRMVVDLENKVSNLYVDNEFLGQFGFKNTTTEDLGYIAFSNIIVDEITVKKSPLMYEYCYYGLREDGTDEIDDWQSKWTETAENEYGHRIKKTLVDFWYSRLGVKMTISNPTGLDKTAVLISAVYDETGKLVSVAISDQKTLNKKAADGTGSELTTFEAYHSQRMAANMSTYTAKTFVFDSMTGLTPVYDAIIMD